MKNIRSKIILAAIAIIAMFTLVACSNNEFDGRGAGEITLTLDAEYDGVRVDCPDGEVTGVGTQYKIKVKSRKQTDVIVSCDGYYTQVVSVLTKDYVDGAATKNVTLEKRYNKLTLTVSGVSDINTVEITSKEDMVKQKIVDGRKLVIEFKDFPADATEIDELSIAADGYYTNKIDVRATDFTDYSATVKTMLLSTSSTDAAVTFINDLSGSRYYLQLYSAYDSLGGNESEADLTVTSAGTVLLDKRKDYYIRTGAGNGSGLEFFTPILLTKLDADSPYLTVRLGELRGSRYMRGDDYYWYGERYNVIVPSEMRSQETNTYIYKADGTQAQFEARESYLYGVNVGETIRVVSYNYMENRLLACYDAEFTGENFALETKIGDDVKIRINYVDKFANPVKVSAAESKNCFIKLFNGHNYGRYFVADESNEYNYLDVTDPVFGGIAEKEEYAISINVKKLFDLEIRLGSYAGEKYVEHQGSWSLYFMKNGQENGIGIFDCLRGNTELLLPEPLDFRMKFYKYNADSAAPKQYLTDIECDTFGENFAYDDQSGYYTLSTENCALYTVSLYSGENYSSATARYEDVTFVADEAFYEKSGKYCVFELPLYEINDVRFANEGDRLPTEDVYGSVSFEGVKGSFEVLGEKDGDWRISRVNESVIGKKFTVTLRTYGGYSTRYEAQGTLTQEIFDGTETLVLNFTRIQDERN